MATATHQQNEILCPDCHAPMGIGFRVTVSGGSRTRRVADDRTARGVRCKSCTEAHIEGLNAAELTDRTRR